MPETDEEWVPVPEAARAAGVSRDRVYRWVQKGLLAEVHTRQGMRVRLSAVQALASASSARGDLPPDLPEYVPPYVAARVTGHRRTTISAWGHAGKVATQPGAHGLLVRLADVVAYAASRRAPTSEAQE